MQRRHDLTNVPIELIRTFLTIVSTKSYSETGKVLGLTQPAVTAQVKRLDQIFGGSLIQAGTRPIELTTFGRSLIPLARAFLDANDRLIASRVGTYTRTQVRLGLSSLYASDFHAACREYGPLQNVALSVGRSDEMDKLFQEGQLDIICCLQPSPTAHLVTSWEEQIVWVRSPSFEPRPGMPIPIVALQGANPDTPILDALRRHGTSFNVVFRSSEFRTRIEAVAAGVGLTAIPRRYIEPPVEEFEAPYLPRIRPVIAAVRAQSTDLPEIDEILLRLTMNKPLDTGQTPAEPSAA